MKTFVAFLIQWWPVIFRGSLWMFLAAVTAMIDELADITNAMLPEMTWLDWLKMSLQVFLAALISLRTFIDKSVTTYSPKALPATGADKTD